MATQAELAAEGAAAAGPTIEPIGARAAPKPPSRRRKATREAADESV
jgi:hypothetical protein